MRDFKQTRFEKGFAEIVDSDNDAILVTSLNGQIQYANKIASDITGFNKDELCQMHYSQLAVPEKSSILETEIFRDSVEKSHDFSEKTHLLTKNGALVAVEFTGIKMVWENHPAYLLIFRESKIFNVTKVLSKAANRRVPEQEPEVEVLRRQLSSKESALIEKDAEIARLNEELLKANDTISVLAKHIDHNKNDYGAKVSKIVCAKILPIVQQLKRDQNFKHMKPLLNMLEFHVNILPQHDMAMHLSLANLTDTEMQIASLVKNGMRSKKIAELLNISYETVKTHRKNIRKKLKLKGTHINLSTYLDSTAVE